MRIKPPSVLVMLVSAPALAIAADWKPADNPLTTPWTANVTAAHALPEYPRPQMVRPRWTNLNGLWDYAIRPKDEGRPAQFEGSILVPFALESALSGVGQPFGPEDRLWYRRGFAVPRDWDGQRVLLHFGAVDYECTLWVNGGLVGSQRPVDGFRSITQMLLDLQMPRAAIKKLVSENAAAFLNLPANRAADQNAA